MLLWSDVFTYFDLLGSSLGGKSYLLCVCIFHARRDYVLGGRNIMYLYVIIISCCHN